MEMLSEISRESGRNMHGIAEPEDIFDPRHYAPVRLKGARPRCLPLWCYTSSRFFDAEQKRVFSPNWNYLERLDAVPNRRDYRALTFMNVPLLMVRGNDDKVRVFANTCRHRGALVAEGQGNCKAFACPYHSWTYSPEGALIGAPNYCDVDGKPIIDESNKRSYGLIEIPSASWGGFLFIRFEDSPLCLLDYLGNLPDQLVSYGLEDMVCTKRVVYNMNCNWKCFVENHADAYHFATVHRGSLAKFKTTRATDVPKTNGNVRANFTIHEGSALLLPLPGFEGFRPMPQIDENRKKGTFFIAIRPGMMLTVANDAALALRCEPLSATTSRLTISSLFPKSAVASSDFQELSKNYYRRNEIVVGEDVAISEKQQAGITSPFARMAQLCSTETALNEIANWVLDRVIAPAN
jgi:choline monooxygenase